MQTPKVPSQTGIAIRLTDVRRTFDGGVQAVGGISLTVAAGEFVSILGPSGCGKSTLLRMIAGLDRPTSGKIDLAQPDSPCDAAVLNDPHQHASRQKTAYVFQDAYLLPWRNVRRNVELPLELMGIPRAQRLAAARDALRQVGLADAMDRYPAQLSGGMKMRVSLARALVTDPTLLLLDEPFAALDEITRQKLDEQLRRLWLARGMTILFVTHSVAEATFLSDRAVVLTARPAKTVAEFHLDLPEQRTGPLRATPQFAEQTRAIYEALDRGSK